MKLNHNMYNNRITSIQSQFAVGCGGGGGGIKNMTSRLSEAVLSFAYPKRGIRVR